MPYVAKNSVAINNRYLDSLVNINHVNNNLKDILVYVYIGSIVNNRSKNELITRT